MSSAILGEHQLQADLSAGVLRRLQLSDGSTLSIRLPPEHLRISHVDVVVRLVRK